ncbi:hypothetical protein FX988_01173 [Paraglaciecola mesophila]|uniref:Uncharacterized protein n=1 Tax=Paraglaciecola mesophila TaxID=197222 RepID=A0A857JIZ5_9ALTE|nr:hypothetical protein FX988_01173 [Paraglaciecola mesophila]
MEQSIVTIQETVLVLLAIAIVSVLFSYFFVAKALIANGVSKTKSIIAGKASTTILILLASFLYLYFR